MCAADARVFVLLQRGLDLHNGAFTVFDCGRRCRGSPWCTPMVGATRQTDTPCFPLHAASLCRATPCLRGNHAFCACVALWVWCLAPYLVHSWVRQWLRLSTHFLRRPPSASRSTFLHARARVLCRVSIWSTVVAVWVTSTARRLHPRMCTSSCCPRYITTQHLPCMRPHVEHPHTLLPTYAPFLLAVVLLLGSPN